MLRFSRKFPSLIAFALLVLSANALQAATIDKGLTIQVFQVCDDDGNNCASLGPVTDNYFTDEVNKIWAQAGIAVGFHYAAQINSSAYSYLNDAVMGDGFGDLSGAYGTHGASTTTVDMFLIHSVAGAYGEGYLGFGGFVISMDDVMSFNSGNGRIDTIAHELGHNLGLNHTTLNNSQLMAPGTTRVPANTLGDIAPDGANLDQISAAFIATARTSSLLSDLVSTPEPASFALLGLGLLAAVISRRHKN